MVAAPDYDGLANEAIEEALQLSYLLDKIPFKYIADHKMSRLAYELQLFRSKNVD